MTSISLVSRSSAAVALLLFTAVSIAATPINETRPLAADGQIEISNIKGRVDVLAWDRPEVRIEGSLGKGAEKLQIEGDSRRLVVKVKYPSRGMGLFSNDATEPSNLRLMVPRRVDMEINVVSAGVEVGGVAAGRLSINSVSGRVVVVGAPSKVEVDSVSGHLDLTVNSPQVDLETVSGTIVLAGRLDGDVELETVSGDIAVTGHQSSVRELSVSSVSGGMRIATALAAGGRIYLESVSGDLRLDLPANLSANVRGKSFSGKLVAPQVSVERPRHGPGSSFSHRYGGGDGDISIESFSGDGRLRLH